MGTAPIATTLKLAVAPEFTARLTGWLVIRGGELTEMLAGFEMTLPTTLETTTS
jgi:hypothetical protein